MNIEIYIPVEKAKHLEFCMKKCKIPIVETKEERTEIANYNINNITLKQFLNLTAYCVVQTQYTKNPVHGKFASVFVHDFY